MATASTPQQSASLYAYENVGAAFTAAQRSGCLYVYENVGYAPPIDLVQVYSSGWGQVLSPLHVTIPIRLKGLAILYAYEDITS